MANEVEKEIEKLRIRKVSIVNKVNKSTSSDEKEGYEEELEAIQRQIEILERFKNR